MLSVNAYLLMADEPVVIDTGVGLDSEEFIAVVGSIVDPTSLKWVWLTHDDADHTGSIQRIMELAPSDPGDACLQCTWWPVALERVHAIRFGDHIDVGDRILTAVAPPLFDSPLAMGILDTSTGALFSVDAFGAILPEPTQDLSEVSPETVAGGMLGWATSDSPWAHVADRDSFRQVLDNVRRLQPRHIFSSHLPAAQGTSLEEFLAVLEMVPDAEPFMPPDSAQFGQMIEALTQLQREGGPDG